MVDEVAPVEFGGGAAVADGGLGQEFVVVCRGADFEGGVGVVGGDGGDVQEGHVGVGGEADVEVGGEGAGEVVGLLEGAVHGGFLSFQLSVYS